MIVSERKPQRPQPQDHNEQIAPERRVRATRSGNGSSAPVFCSVYNWEGLPPELLHISRGKEERKAALEWLSKKDRAANIRAGLIDAITLVTMIAACIAAWRMIKEWLSR
jgi:hypothetical protein